MKVMREYGISVIPSDATVTVTKAGHVVEVQYMERENRSCPIRVLNANEYVVVETGEIRECKHIENRSQSYKSLRRTFRRLRYLINENFSGGLNEWFLTLTYAENMRDTKRLCDDFRKFIQRLKYLFRGRSSIDYIAVAEPQGRGAWHMHVLIRFNELSSVYVPQRELQDLWGHGFVWVNSMRGVDDIGSYLTAYLADVELDGSNDSMKAVFEVFNREEPVRLKDVNGKKYLKGGRLHLYPPGMKIYRKSRGIREPKRERMRYAKIKEVVGDAQPHYSMTVNIDDGTFQNTISYEQYNLKRVRYELEETTKAVSGTEAEPEAREGGPA